MSPPVAPAPSVLVAIDIALDELTSYIDTVGDADEAQEKLRWAQRILGEFLKAYNYPDAYP